MKRSKTKRKVNHKKGGLRLSRATIAIVTADFNEYFTEKLVDGAVDHLIRSGLKETSIDVVHVPGSFEIPLIVKKILKKKKYNAIIALGVVIKGETRHFQHVVDAASQGTLQASLDYEIPVIHGVVPAENIKQAIDRAGGKLGNKGRDCAKAAIEMINLIREL